MQVRSRDHIEISTRINRNWYDIFKSFSESSDGALYHKTLIGFMTNGASINRGRIKGI